jgi:antitoxin component YwqK of YwqJK toxin-antitoxin module
MDQKALSHNKIVSICIALLLFGCSAPIAEKPNNIFEKVDVSQIPKDTIFSNSQSLKLQNGVYYYDNKPFSGYIKSTYNSNILQSIGSYLQGKQHGTTQTFFTNGKLETERNYRNGIGYGRHFGFWENGKMKFDFMYFNDKREGVQKQWYVSGNPYYELTFADDKENGMQKAWRENGKPYINYEVKDGVQYGLQKSALCYTLKDEKFK